MTFLATILCHNFYLHSAEKALDNDFMRILKNKSSMVPLQVELIYSHRQENRTTVNGYYYLVQLKDDWSQNNLACFCRLFDFQLSSFFRIAELYFIMRWKYYSISCFQIGFHKSCLFCFYFPLFSQMLAVFCTMEILLCLVLSKIKLNSFSHIQFSQPGPGTTLLGWLNLHIII